MKLYNIKIVSEVAGVTLGYLIMLRLAETWKRMWNPLRCFWRKWSIFRAANCGQKRKLQDFIFWGIKEAWKKLLFIIQVAGEVTLNCVNFKDCASEFSADLVRNVLWLINENGVREKQKKNQNTLYDSSFGQTRMSPEEMTCGLAQNTT